MSGTSRRDFLRNTVGSGAVLCLGGADKLLGRAASAADAPVLPAEQNRKLIIVVFGGGTRSSESVDDPEHRHIPRLWNEMVPRGTLFTNARVERRVVHPNCTGSILTGHWEWDDIDWSRPVAHPTVFETHRKASGKPDTAAWAFSYASILAKAGESRAPGFGERFAANVVTPPTIPRSAADEMSKLARQAAASGSVESELAAAGQCERLARERSGIARTGLRSEAARKFLDREYENWRSAAGTTSHDAFLTDRAINCMREFAPDVVTVAYGEIDCAHYGSWSRYVEAIRRTDEFTWRLWRATQELSEYRGRTLMLVLPDHGRELDQPGRWGFIHHSDFYTNEDADEGCRRVWMLAIGPGVTAGSMIAEPVPITAAATTGLEYLGLSASPGAARPMLSLAAEGA